MTLSVREVRSKKDYTAFQRLPWDIYRSFPQWIPPLLQQERQLIQPGKHPFHEHALTTLFLACKGDDVVGRIGACLNEQHNIYHGEHAGFFGFFECQEDPEVADVLFRAASSWLKKQGSVCIRGPFNWSTNESCGLLVEGFDAPPRVMMPYNPPYYAALMEDCGLAKIKDLITFELPASAPVPERFERIARRARDRAGVRIRTMSKKSFDTDVGIIKEIYNQAWSKNWGFVPMTSAEMKHMAREMKSVIDYRLVLIAEIDGSPAGFAMTIPDANQVLCHLNGRLFPFGFIKALWYSRSVNFARLITLGIKDDFRRKGIEAILIIETLLRARNAGYVGGELGWVLEDNRLMIRDIEAIGAVRNKRYRIYEAPLS